MDLPDAPAPTVVASDNTDGSGRIHKDLRAIQDREAMVDRLQFEGAPDLAKHLDNCGQRVGLVCTHCGDHRSTETRCRKRWCPVCAPLVQKERLRRWSYAVSKLEWPLFLTLTQQNTVTVEGMDQIKKAWSKFRRRKLIRERVAGGVASFEVTNKGNGWHYHLHAIVDCRWLALYTREPKRNDPPEVKEALFRSAKSELSSLWADQLQQPIAIVDASRVAGDSATVYILKYATKPSDLLAVQEPIAPLIQKLRKSRLIAGFGCLHPLPAIDIEHKLGTVCECCGTASQWMPDEIAIRHAQDQRALAMGRTVRPSQR